MKAKYKAQSIRARKSEVIGDNKELWDKPLTTPLAKQIVKSMRLSHWSIIYDFWFEYGPEGDFSTVTWNDLETHDAGWMWVTSRENAKSFGWTEKQYHQDLQQRLADEAEYDLISITEVKELPINHRPSKAWQSTEKKTKYHVSKIITGNAKGKPTTGYYIYRTDVTDITPDRLIVI